MRRCLYIFALLCLTIALPACSSEEGETVVSDQTGEGEAVDSIETALPEEPPTEVWGGSTSYLRSSDETPLAVEWLQVEGAEPRGTVILIHMLGRSRGDWQPLVQPLIENGFYVVGIDLRGHGQSALQGSYTDFTPDDWMAARGDVHAAVDFAIPDKPDPYFVCGASIGANLTFLDLAEDNRPSGVILLSPGDDYRGVKPSEGLEAYGDRPALLVAAEDDEFSAQTVRDMAAELPNARFEIYPDGGHGTRLLTSRPELQGLIIDWLVQQVAEK